MISAVIWPTSPSPMGHGSSLARQSSESPSKLRENVTSPGGTTRAALDVLMADQGMGIPHDVRDRLFSPFFTTKKSVGTGLGLWVTRGIVEKQGGCIGFRTCTDVPSGTVFRVFLPAESTKGDAFDVPQPRFLQ